MILHRFTHLLLLILTAAIAPRTLGQTTPASDQTTPANPNFKAKGIENSKWDPSKSSNRGVARHLYLSGRKQLRLDFTGGEKRSTFFSNRPGFKPPKDRILKLDVYSPVENPPDISVALTLTYHFIWTESPRVKLKKGWNRVRISLDKANWSSELSDSKPTSKIGEKPDIRFMNIIVWNGKKSGYLVLEGIVPEALAQRIGDKKVDDSEYWKPMQKKLAGDTRGFLVWESNRTGHWRLWRKNLDGTGLKMIGLNDDQRDHFCPHISPDGKRIVYLSYVRGRNGYSYLSAGEQVHLRIMNADGTDDQLLRSNARTYLEDRAVVWIDNDQFIFIGGEGITRIFDLKTKKTIPLLVRKSPRFGWLINSKLTFATKGFAQFSPYIRESSSIIPWPKIDGCQPYFSHDGQWGFWMIDSGGPLRKIHLSSGETGEILQRFDERLPPSRGYIYFPMVSRCGNLLTFGASPTQHDQFRSDYDIFVARCNPQTLEIIGKPVRYTFHPKTDRFPDVHYRYYALGQKMGEVPFSCTFNLPEGYTWSSGNGNLNIDKPGTWEVAATKGKETVYGQVIVAPARPPRLVKTTITGEKRMLLTFDEPVNLSNAKITVDGKDMIETKTIQAPNKVSISLSMPIDGLKNVRLSGIVDRARKPNVMPETELELQSAGWPKSRDGLAFLWDRKTAANQVADPKTGKLTAFNFTRVGAACYDGRSAMCLHGGYMESADANAHLTCMLEQTGCLTLTVTLSAEAMTSKPATVFSLTTQMQPRLRLYQLGSQLMADAFSADARKTMILGHLELGAIAQATLCISPTAFRGWFNGRAISEANIKVEGWKDCRLRFGADAAGRAPWLGTLQGIAGFNRSMNTSQVSELYQSYRLQIAAQKHPRIVRARLRLLINTRIPTLDSIKPYKDAIIGQRYLVEKILGGKLESKQIFVYHWAFIGGKNVFPAHLQRPGAVVTLDLEPLDAQPKHLLRTHGIAGSAEENEEELPEYFAPSISGK